MNYNGEKPERSGERTICSLTQIWYLLLFLLLLSGSGVSAEIVPGFAGIPTDGPTPLTVSFIDQSVSVALITGYLWDFGDGSSNSTEKNPNHTYIGIGRYNVSLTVTDTNGVSNTITMPRYIHVRPSEYPAVMFAATPQNGTTSQAVLFLDQSELDPAVPDEMYTYIWNFGDGSLSDASNTRNIQHTYTRPGEYTTQLQIQDQKGAKHNAPAPVIVTITNGTSTTSAAFTAIPVTGPTPLTVSFIDQSSNPSSITAYAWDFGDNETSSEKNPVHSYMGIGKYNVTLTITNADGMRVTTAKPSYVHVQPSEYPVVKYTALPLDTTVNQDVYFIDQSELDPAVSDEMYTYLWDFGDGSASNISNIRNVQHRYTKPGNYTTQLQIQDQKGAKFNAPTPVMITITNQTSPVQALFTANPLSGPVPLNVSFTDHSTSLVSISTYTWDFGDNSTSTQKNPVHTYMKTGTYDVTLTITNADGIQATTTEPAYIHVQPSKDLIVKFTAVPTNGTAPLNVLFTDQSVLDPTVPIEMYRFIWNFGDNTPVDRSNTRTIEHRYDRPGTYAAKLEIQDRHGRRNIWSNPVMITVTNQPTPVKALFTASPLTGSVPLPVFFVDQSTGPIAHTQYMWDFGDGTSPSSEVNPIHTYGIAGTYNVTLKISNEFGSDVYVRKNYISVIPPHSYIITATASSNGAITPSGAVIVPDGADQSFTISPNSGSSIKDVQINGKSIGVVSTHNFNHVTSNQTIHADFATTVIPPDANFIADKDSGIVPLTVQFTDTSIGSPNSWFWNFGDGTNSVQQNPSHIYTKSGEYTVGLTIRNGNGMSEKRKLSFIIVT